MTSPRSFEPPSRDRSAVPGGASGARRRVWALAAGVVLLCVLVLWRVLAAPAPAAPASHDFAGATMGTTYSVTVEGELAAGDARRVAETIEARLGRVEGLLSTYDPASELSRLNAHAAAEPFAVGRELFEVLTAARTVSDRSGGAFDVTVAPLVAAWGFGAAGPAASTPDGARLEALMERVGHRLLVLDPDARSVTKLVPGVMVDLSGIAKGYAADHVAAGLAELGHASFLVEVGGELSARGRRHDGRSWRIGIEAPVAGASTLYGTLELSDEAVATSGDYRDYEELDGARLAHVIDPRSGRPLELVGTSVSVVHPDGAAADAWATALLVLGPETGFDLASREGVAAVFVTRAGERLVSRVTPAMADRFTELY